MRGKSRPVGGPRVVHHSIPVIFLCPPTVTHRPIIPRAVSGARTFTTPDCRFRTFHCERDRSLRDHRRSNSSKSILFAAFSQILLDSGALSTYLQAVIVLVFPRRLQGSKVEATKTSLPVSIRSVSVVAITKPRSVRTSGSRRFTSSCGRHN
jgi:hypothetical protein